MKPNLFIIGAPKCGTSALASYLADHPDVFFSKPKEPLFWSTDLGIEPHALSPKNLDEYLKLFSGADQGQKIIAEGSTTYLRSHVAIEKILEFNPSAKFIAMLRNPVEVVHAFHMEQLHTTMEPYECFSDAWKDQEMRENAYDSSENQLRFDSLLYRRIASFPRQLSRFFNNVDPERRHVILYDDFRADPQRVYSEALQFLQIEHDGRTNFPRVNAAHRNRFPRLSSFFYNPPRIFAPLLKSVRQKIVQTDSIVLRSFKNLLRKQQPREPLTGDIHNDVAAHFAVDILKMEEHLNRDLSSWKSDNG